MKTVAMSGSSKRVQNAIIVGGGIGGLAAALALARQGISVDLLEAASEIGEIGAGIQLAANAFNALDALGVGEATRKRSVFTDRLLLMDALDAHEVASVDFGAPYRTRFGTPYAVIHREIGRATCREWVCKYVLISVVSISLT